MAKRKYYQLFTIIVLLALFLISFIIITIYREKTPKLLNIDDPNEVFTIKKAPDWNGCLVQGKPNNFGIRTVVAASKNIDLKKYIGKKVKLRGQFISSSSDAVKDCILTYIKGSAANARVVLEVTEVNPL